MSLFWERFGGVVLGGAIGLAGTYLANLWQTRRESESYRRGKRESVAAQVWELASRCHGLIHKCSSARERPEELRAVATELDQAWRDYTGYLGAKELYLVSDACVWKELGCLRGHMMGFSSYFDLLSGPSQVADSRPPDWTGLASAYQAVRVSLCRFASLPKPDVDLD